MNLRFTNRSIGSVWKNRDGVRATIVKYTDNKGRLYVVFKNSEGDLKRCPVNIWNRTMEPLDLDSIVV